MTQNKIEIHFTDKDHVWINGRQYISLGRVGQMLSEKHKTNADRIRAMTDEELAIFIAVQRSRYCNFKDPSEDEYPKVLLWLKSPAES